MNKENSGRALVMFNHSIIESLSIEKLRDLIRSVFDVKKKPTFVKFENKQNFKTFTILFLKKSFEIPKGMTRFINELESTRIPKDLPYFFTVYPLQDNFSLQEIEEIIFKEIDEDIVPDLAVLQHVEYLKYFVVKEPFSIWLDDDKYVHSEISVGTIGKLGVLRYKSPYKETAHKLVSMDCEMLETDVGSELGRVTLLDIKGEIILDVYVHTTNKIIDYRTKYSGLSKSSFENSVDFHTAQSMVLDVIGHNTIILGHSLLNDLRILKIKHDKLIDTSRLFRSRDNRKISLKRLSIKYRCIQIQNGTHCSYEDAYACLQLLSIKIRMVHDMFRSKKYFNFVQCRNNVRPDELSKTGPCLQTSFVTMDELKELNILERTNEIFLVIYSYDKKNYVGVYDSKRD